MTPIIVVDLVWPFGDLEGLDRDDFREAAYEIFFTACRSSPGFGGRTAAIFSSSDGSGEGNGSGSGSGLSGPGSPKPTGVGMAITSRVKTALGLKMLKKYPSRRKSGGGGGVNGPSSPAGVASPRTPSGSTVQQAKIRRPLTSAEIMRLQMRVSEQSDNRLRKTLMRTLVGQVEAKRALSREEQQGPKSGNMGSARSFGGGGNTRTKKIFVGGLPPTLTEDGFRTYFETYGNVTDVAIMFDQQTNRPRGFGFISFDSEDAVDRVLHKTYHDLSGKQVEVKRALPKDGNSGFGGRSTGNGGSGMGGGSYQGYGASGDNPSSYDRMDTNSYMQSQNTGGGYPSYGSSGYGTAGYGYGSSNNGMGYGAYGSYGGANPGYGGVNPGYGSPAVAAFGNPNVPSTGYGSGQAGGPRSSWGSQVPSGYGNMGYGNASWGASSAGGGGGAATGQSPTGATGYGNQGYGYGGYGGNDGAYGNPSIGGGASGDMQSGGGYMGSGYGDANGNSTLRSDTAQGSGNYGSQQNGPYGGGYGGAPSRQAQQH